mgnify:CR=1 FL=1
MVLLGLRFSKMVGLSLCDIDFVNNTVSVNKILIYKTNEGLITFKEFINRNKNALFKTYKCYINVYYLEQI